jgi:hypothetical protein
MYVEARLDAKTIVATAFEALGGQQAGRRARA